MPFPNVDHPNAPQCAEFNSSVASNIAFFDRWETAKADGDARTSKRKTYGASNRMEHTLTFFEQENCKTLIVNAFGNHWCGVVCLGLIVWNFAFGLLRVIESWEFSTMTLFGRGNSRVGYCARHFIA